MLKRFLKDDSGATAIEYGILAAGVAVAIIAAVGLIGDALVDMLTNAANAIKAPPAE